MPKGVSLLGKFKQTVVEDLRKESSQLREAMRNTEGGTMSIQHWERYLRVEGKGRKDSLKPERRGRGK